MSKSSLSRMLLAACAAALIAVPAVAAEKKKTDQAGMSGMDGMAGMAGGNWTCSQWSYAPAMGGMSGMGGMDNCIQWTRNSQGVIQCSKLATPKK